MTCYYDDSTATFRLVVKISWLQVVADTLNLQVQLLEDSIIDWQYDERATPQYVENYVHRHMFRRSVNGTWGVPLPAVNAGTVTEFEYTQILDPDSKGFKKEHISFVAFIYFDPADEYEVMQVNEVHLLNHH
jgi:hypothetical protein